jgi:mannose-6-phosphate isomerase-like protein (cupin superfamily)
MFKRVSIFTMLVTLGLFGILSAQQPIKRTPLQKPNVNVGRHTHPGPESGYLLEGEFTLLVDGQPPLVVKAGDSYKVPPGAIHDARSGDKGAKVIATYVVEKGKPLASPAQ